MKKVILIIIAILLAALLGYAAYKACTISLSYKESRDTYQTVSNAYTTRVELTFPDTDDEPIIINGVEQEAGMFDPIVIIRDTCPINVDFEGLLELNKDCVGWIYHPDDTAGIDFPVMQGRTNQDYLHQLITKKLNAGGSIFMDWQNKRDMTNYNTILYGHAMADGSMFGQLKRYWNQAYYEKYPYLYFSTPTQNYRLEIIGCITRHISDREPYAFFNTVEELHAYLEKVVEESVIDSATDIYNVEKIMTLSTCSHEYGGARWLVICNVVPI